MGEPLTKVGTPTGAVFLSYASQDAQAAQSICEALRAAGIEVWFDQSELRGGDAWDQAIRRQIRDCALFIPIISAHTQARPEGYFRLEWKLAVDRSHLMAAEKAFLVPVVVDATTELEALVPALFREVQWTRIQADEPPAAFVDRIAALLKKPVAIPLGRSAQPAGRVRLRRLPMILVALSVAALIALAVATALRFGSAWHEPVAKVEPRAASEPVAPPLTNIAEKSVAVLPFADMSEKKDQEYFADGLTEELIDLLARESDIKIPARTSSFYFKGKQATVAEIAKALGVAHVLEGSVRKAGDTMRITVQLIHAADGFHVWSSSYDRKSKDIFHIQDEIAAAAVSALKARLSTSLIVPGVRRAASAEAHDEYLIGRQFISRRGIGDTKRAAAAFQKAITLDPTFAAAYAGLSEAQYLDALETNKLTLAEFRRIQAQLDRAIELGPDLSEGYSERGVDRLEYLGDVAGAEADLSRAIAIEPSSSRNQRRYGFLLRCVGRVDEAIRYGTQATDTDPLDGFAWLHLGESLIAGGRYEQAHDAFAKLVELNPDDTDGLPNLFNVMLLQGRGGDVLASVTKLRDPLLELYYTAIAEYAIGHERESLAALNSLVSAVQHDAQRRGLIADVYAWRSEVPQSIAWLEKLGAERKGAITCTGTNPPYLHLRGDAQFTEFLRRMNVPE